MASRRREASVDEARRLGEMGRGNLSSLPCAVALPETIYL